MAGSRSAAPLNRSNFSVIIAPKIADLLMGLWYGLLLHEVREDRIREKWKCHP
jgi:hypothetical protein